MAGSHARIRKVELHEKWREKIRVSMILNHLNNHIVGRINMSRTQLMAAKILLDRVMPILQATDLTALDADGKPLAIALVTYDPTQLSAPALPAPDTESSGLRH